MANRHSCPGCGTRYDSSVKFCPTDGLALSPEGATGPKWLGRVLDGRYEIEAQIGSGGMGQVYRAIQIAVPRPVAVKVLRRELQNGTAFKRFEIEAKIVAQLRHPAVLKLIDYGQTEEGELYMVTELLHGESLQERLTRAPFTPHETKELLRQVADGLIEAHALGIVHRDLKPANLFIEDVAGRMRVRILDFGIAKIAEQEGLTQTGAVFGTPAFLAPEQAKAEPVDARTDLYSLGVVAYVCLSGALPFTGRSAPALLYEQVHVPPPELPDSLQHAEPDLVAVVLQLMQKLPADRYPDAASLRDHMEQLADTSGDTLRGGSAARSTDPAFAPTFIPFEASEALATRIVEPPHQAEKRRSGRWLALVGLVASLGLGAAYMGRPATPAPTSLAPGVSNSTAPAAAKVQPTLVPVPTSTPAVQVAAPKVRRPKTEVRQPRVRRRSATPKPAPPAGFIPVLSAPKTP